MPETRSSRPAIVAAVLTMTIMASVTRSDGPTTRPAADTWARHYDERVAQFRVENQQARNIVFVGSSHVEGFDAGKLLPGSRVLNRGIGSDHIGVDGRGVLARLNESVFDCNPRLVLLENGVNDLGDLLAQRQAGYRRDRRLLSPSRRGNPQTIAESSAGHHWTLSDP